MLNKNIENVFMHRNENVIGFIGHCDSAPYHRSNDCSVHNFKPQSFICVMFPSASNKMSRIACEGGFRLFISFCVNNRVIEFNRRKSSTFVYLC